jgi:hypothetical protein
MSGSDSEAPCARGPAGASGILSRVPWLALLLWLVVAEPQEEPTPPVTAIELHWSAPDECPDREAFLEAMSVIAGRRLITSPAAELVVDGRIESPSSGGYALRLRLRGPLDEELRSLEAPECDALVSAGSLVVVTRLLGAIPPPPDDQPIALEPTPAAPPDTAVPVPPPAATAPQLLPPDDLIAPLEPGPRPEPPAPDRLPLQATLAALTGVAVGLGPRPAPAVRVGVGLRWSSLRIEAPGASPPASW